MLALNRFGIKSLDEFLFAKLKKLRILDLTNNEIGKLQEKSLAGLENLEILYLGGNKLKFFWGFEFSNLKKLRVLALSGNLIESFLIDPFEVLTELRELHLDTNLFEYIPGHILKSNTKLSELDFGNNRILLIPREIIVNVFVKLKRLDLSNNNCVDQLFEYHDVPNPFKQRALLEIILYPFCNNFELNLFNLDETSWFLIGLVILTVVIVLMIFACLGTLLIARRPKKIGFEVESNFAAKLRNHFPAVADILMEYTDQSSVHGIKYLGEKKRHWGEK